MGVRNQTDANDGGADGRCLVHQLLQISIRPFSMQGDRRSKSQMISSTLPQFREQPLSHPLRLRRISPAEQISVIEHMVEDVEIAPHGIAVVEWPGAAI